MTIAAAPGAPALESASPTAVSSLHNPYPGLRAFRSDEHDFFVGRELVLPQVETRVRTSPLTVMFARSGVGKTSFLTCRLEPALKEESRCRSIRDWGEVKPDERILDEVNKLQLDAGPSGELPVLILDQFEDVFKTADDRRYLWAMLGALVNVSTPQVHVLISIREEWLGAWAEAAQYLPDAYRTMFRLEPLGRDELGSAVTVPPQHVKGTPLAVSPGFVTALLDDLSKKQAFGFGRAYIEPGMVQLVCQRMWNEAINRRENTVDRPLYDELGGVDGIIEDFVWNALHSDSVAGGFTLEDQIYWIAITQQLSLAYGVKSIVTADAICRKIRTADFGVAGEAILGSTLGRKDRAYLRKRGIRKRPPQRLLKNVSAVLDKGVKVGFLKPQSASSGGQTVYELHHDALGPFLTDFASTFEQELRRRARIAAMILAPLSALVIMVAIVLIWVSFSWMAKRQPPSETEWWLAAAYTVGISIATYFYTALGLAGFWIWKKVSGTFGYPVIRRIVRSIRPPDRGLAAKAGGRVSRPNLPSPS